MAMVKAGSGVQPELPIPAGIREHPGAAKHRGYCWGEQGGAITHCCSVPPGEGRVKVLPWPQQGLGLAELVLLTQQHSQEALLHSSGSYRDVITYCTGVLLAKTGCKAPQQANQALHIPF